MRMPVRNAVHGNTNDDDKKEVDFNRRDFLSDAPLVTVGVFNVLSFLTSSPSYADNEGSSSSSLPICVIGSNGRVGQQCVRACLSRSIPVRATSRSGTAPATSNSSLSGFMLCDVTNPETIAPAVQNTRAVIFAASASKQGGTAAAVDNAGLVNVAKACLEANVPHLVIVSSGGVSKPDSTVYKFLNVFGNIMDAKIQGETTVRAMYHHDGSTSDDNKRTYTIVRPGGLTDEPERGVSALELNQGDTKSGRISRADVANLCIEATLYPKYTGGVTLECYNADTAKPLQTVGLSNLLKMTSANNHDSFVGGKEHRGNTWEDIFHDLERDL